MSQGDDVHLAGRGLISALGHDLGAAVARLGRPAAATPLQTVAPGCALPYRAIANGAADWASHARATITACVAACGRPGDPRAPLLVASSSLNVGALEDGAPFLPDCLAFVEEIARWLDWQGPVHWVSTACTSSINALLAARDLLRDGGADEALVLGVELRNRFTAAGFAGMQLLDPVGARPLAADRAGLGLGEAVAALRLSRAPARWRLCGGANVIDGGDPAGASADAVRSMALAALADAGRRADDIDLIKLQAAGSPHNDAAELAGLRRVFPRLPPLITLKAQLGHTLGAAGAAEIALLTAMLDAGRWPAAPGSTAASTPASAPDPALDAVLADAPPARCRTVLASILGFGGGHSAVVLEDTGRSPT